MVKRRRRTKKIKRRKQKGGNIPTFIGKALNYSNLNTWPGLTNHGGNHYAYNKLPVDLQTGNMKSEGDSFFKENLMSGGYTYKNNKNFSSETRRRRSSRRKYKGGNFPLLGDLRTGSQVIQNSLVNTQHVLEGKPTFVSPLSWKNQYI